MDRPLGAACGNALEVAEAIDVLNGGGPSDLIGVTMALGAEMLILGNVATSRDGAREMMNEAIASGKAMAKFEEIISAQGGDGGVTRDPSRLPRARHTMEVHAKRAGVVQIVGPREIGYGVIALGGGRKNMEDTVDPSVGFVIQVKPGGSVEKGQPLGVVHARSTKDLELGISILEKAVTIGESRPSPLPLVSHRVTARGVEELAPVSGKAPSANGK
jgi:thymidine phosphorylase